MFPSPRYPVVPEAWLVLDSLVICIMTRHILPLLLKWNEEFQKNSEMLHCIHRSEIVEHDIVSAASITMRLIFCWLLSCYPAIKFLQAICPLEYWYVLVILDPGSFSVFNLASMNNWNVIISLHWHLSMTCCFLMAHRRTCPGAQLAAHRWVKLDCTVSLWNHWREVIGSVFLDWVKSGLWLSKILFMGLKPQWFFISWYPLVRFSISELAVLDYPYWHPSSLPLIFPLLTFLDFLLPFTFSSSFWKFGCWTPLWPNSHESHQMTLFRHSPSSSCFMVCFHLSQGWADF